MSTHSPARLVSDGPAANTAAGFPAKPATASRPLRLRGGQVGAIRVDDAQPMQEDYESFSRHEDPAQVQLFVYAFGAGLAAVAAAGLMFRLQPGVLFRAIASHKLRDVAASNKRFLPWPKLAALAGADTGIYYSACAEPHGSA